MSVIRTKQTMLTKVEVSEGVSSDPGPSDAVEIFDLDYTDDFPEQERRPAGRSMSTEFTDFGRESRQFTFETEFKGSGDTDLSGGIDEFESARFLKTAGYKRASMKEIDVGAVTGTGFQVGEQVTQDGGDVVGIVVGCFSGSTLVDQIRGAGGTLVVVPLVGTFTAAATAGASSGSTAAATSVDDYAGLAFRPTSDKLVRVQTAAWSNSTPPAIGDALDVRNAEGQMVGGVMLIKTTGAPMVDIQVQHMWGKMLNGHTLHSPAGESAAISQAPEQTDTPSITCRHNLDGRQRDSVGARCDFTGSAEVGETFKFQWTAQGDLLPPNDTPQPITQGLSAIRGPSMRGALLAYGAGADLYRLSTKSMGFSNGNTLAPNLDGNAEGGSTGTNVTDRGVEMTLGTDQVHGTFDWEEHRRQKVPVRTTWLLGRTKGNIVGIVAPRCQITGITPGDQDNIATFDITIKPRRVLESGDDEVFFVQL